jgi:diadenosine tetraphosphatase ApaH/serine/threonine PP2A family protein phosphatase
MSRILLISDVHGNLLALEAALAAAGAVDGIWAMGDTVGYGPDPSDVLALLKERRARMVAGNHDLAVATGQGLDAFNPHAREAARIHRSWLTAAERDDLAVLPLTVEQGEFTLCHGSLRDPVWEYVFTAAQADASIGISPTPHACNGHTHVPAIFRKDARVTQVPFREGRPVTLIGRMLVNPGSVGQPRDGDPRAAYAIYDSQGGGTIELQRSSYDVNEVQRRIRTRGLPGVLADRLAVGY